MTPIFVGIVGPGDLGDLINGGREVIARHGYQVGEFVLVQDLIAEGAGICGSIEVDDRLVDKLEEDGGFELSWGEYEVAAETP